MDTIKWTSVNDEPVPDNDPILVMFDKPVLGSLLHMRTQVGGTDSVAGLFLFDIDVEIKYWRRVNDLVEELRLVMIDNQPS